MRFSAELNLFLLSTTPPHPPPPPPEVPTAFTPTSSSSPSESSSEPTTLSTLSESSSLAVNRIPMTAIIGGTVGGILLLVLILGTWLQIRRIRSRRKSELPIQAPPLSSRMESRSRKDHLPPVPSIRSVTRILTEASPFVDQPESMAAPVSPAARSSMIMPFESRPESLASIDLTVLPPVLHNVY